MDTKKMMDVARSQMRGMIDALNRIAMNSGVSKRADKPGTRKDKKKTQRGATHVVNPTFKSRQILALTPALYRSMHRGKVTITPNYLKPHPAPRWRNRYEPQLDR